MNLILLFINLKVGKDLFFVFEGSFYCFKYYFYNYEC